MGSRCCLAGTWLFTQHLGPSGVTVTAPCQQRPDAQWDGPHGQSPGLEGLLRSPVWGDGSACPRPLPSWVPSQLPHSGSVLVWGVRFCSAVSVSAVCSGLGASPLLSCHPLGSGDWAGAKPGANPALPSPTGQDLLCQEPGLGTLQCASPSLCLNSPGMLWGASLVSCWLCLGAPMWLSLPFPGSGCESWGTKCLNRGMPEGRTSTVLCSAAVPAGPGPRRPLHRVGTAPGCAQSQELPAVHQLTPGT